MLKLNYFLCFGSYQKREYTKIRDILKSDIKIQCLKKIFCIRIQEIAYVNYSIFGENLMYNR